MLMVVMKNGDDDDDDDDIVLMMLYYINLIQLLIRCGITGHSMGGHGALMLALRHPEYFK